MKVYRDIKKISIAREWAALLKARKQDQQEGDLRDTKQKAYIFNGTNIGQKALSTKV